MKPMAEKDNDSMATVQIKPEYAPSEVYSTASEAPPAYKRQSNSVKIAKITAFTIIVSSFIIGSFILASAYLQARASCDQVQALDSVLEKELMLETLQQVNKELPRADALISNNNDESDLQNLDRDEAAMMKKVEEPKEEAAPAPASNNEQTNENESDSSFSDSEETDDLQKVPTKVPLELDLSDLAAVLLQNNKKSRMNCVIERKHAEEIVDSPSKTVNLPFGVNLTTDPKKARITGERISIFCETGNEDKEQQQPRYQGNDDNDEVEAIRPMFIPYQRVPIPFGQTPNQFPLTHMPQRMMPPMPQQQQQPPMIRQMPPPFQHMPMGMRPPMPPQIMQAPHPEPMQEQHVRIHVQQLPFREIHVADDVPVQIPSSNQELPHIQVQRVPLGLALQRAGITAEDLRNIQRAAEERMTEGLRHLIAEEVAESNSNSDSNSSEEDDSQGQNQEQAQNQEQQQLQQQLQQRQQEEEQLTTQQLPMEPRDTMTPPMPDQPQILQIGRATYGRSLVSPVHIPIPMNQAQADMNREVMEPERPHYVHPRSVRSTDNVFPSEKRVKKCACDCNC